MTVSLENMGVLLMQVIYAPRILFLVAQREENMFAALLFGLIPET